MVKSTTRPSQELHKCLQQDTTSVWASQIFYCEMRELIAKPKKILECMGKAPCATHMQHIQCFWAALQRQVPCAKQKNRAHLCPVKLSHLHSTGQITQVQQNPLSNSEALENMVCNWQDKVKQLSRWEIHLVDLIHFNITLNTIFWRWHLTLENPTNCHLAVASSTLLENCLLSDWVLELLKQNFC